VLEDGGTRHLRSSCQQFRFVSGGTIHRGVAAEDRPAIGALLSGRIASMMPLFGRVRRCMPKAVAADWLPPDWALHP
jgi:hypothetical protein